MIKSSGSLAKTKIFIKKAQLTTTIFSITIIRMR